MTEDTGRNDDKAERPMPGRTVMPCEDIQALLTAYMTRELGDAQSALIREHLRRCDKCQAAAHEIADALDLLKVVVPGDMPTQLSDEHRARIKRAYTHPFLAWIEMNHMLVSVIITAVLLTVIMGLLVLFAHLARPPEYGPAYPIRIVPPPAPEQLDEVPETPPGADPTAPVSPMPRDPETDRALEELLGPDGIVEEQTQTDYIVIVDPDEEVIPPAEAPEFGNPWALFRLVAVVIVVALICVLVSRLVRAGGLKRSAEEDGTMDEGPAPFE